MANDLEQKIIKQIEYYFGDINLPRDKFLQEKIKEDEGWVPVEVLLTFKRLASLSEDPAVIAAAVEKSESKLVLVNEEKNKLRRNPEQPVPEQTEERKQELMKKSAYVKGFPTETALNDIINFFEPYGPVESVIRRTKPDHKFKGSVFVVFKDVDTCKKFVELESVKFNDVELIKKFQNDYYTQKKQEIEERKKQKKEKQQETKVEKTIDLPKGATVHFTGVQEGQTLTREEIKEKVKEHKEAQYVDYNKGDLEGWIRFPEENNAVEFCKKIENNEVVIGDIKLTIKLLEGEEEEAYLKKTSEAILKNRDSKKRNFGQKRKGNFGHRNNKRSRN